MRVLFMTVFIVLFFALGISAQMPLAQKFFEKGTNLANTGDFREALSFYKKSLQIVETENESKSDELKSKIYLNMGVCLYQTKEFVQAEKQFSKAISYSGNEYPKAQYFLGLTQIELNKLDEAKKSFRKVLETNGEFGEAWFDLAMVLYEQEQFARATNAFRNAIKFKTVRFAEATNNIGVVFARGGQFRLAEREFRRAILASNGDLAIAKVNLRICRDYKRKNPNFLLAKLGLANIGGEQNR